MGNVDTLYVPKTHSDMYFLSPVPTGPPAGLTVSTTSTTSTGTWMEIACIERNGNINSYDVELWERSVVTLNRNVRGRIFTAGGLTPATRYTFRVAGVNSNGTGPFIERTVTTDEASKPQL
jgi:hypothetical protein